MKRVVGVVLAGVLVGGLLFAPSASVALPRGTKVQVFKSGLNYPVDMAWVPGTKRVFFTEKNTGRIRIMRGRKLLSRPCIRLDVANDGEQGALGIVLHPRFKKNKWLYVMYTNATPEDMRVTRFKVRNNRCRFPRTIMSGVPASSGYHNGGQLAFVGNKLFVSTGENHDRAAAQNTSSRLGKILRFNADGSIPSDNPFNLPGNRNPVWTYGHRNPFGLARRPGTRQLFETENGPECDDELNIIRKGRNYGWGTGYQCGGGVGDNPKPPLKRWTPPIVPTDLVWYRGRMKKLSGSLYMGAYNGTLHRFNMNDRGSRIRRHRVIYRGSAIVDVSKGPGGWLYFITPETGSIRRIVPD